MSRPSRLPSARANSLSPCSRPRDALRQNNDNFQTRLSEIDAALERTVATPKGDGADSELVDEQQPSEETGQEGDQQPDAELGRLVENLSNVLKEVRESERRRELFEQRLEELAAALADRAESTEHMDDLAKQSREADERVAAAKRAVDDAEDSLRRANEGAESARLVVLQAEERLSTATQTLETTQQELATVRVELPPPSPIVGACFSNDGAQLLFAAQSGDAFIFHVNGTPLGQWKAAAADVTCARLLNDGGAAALTSQSGTSLTIWSTQPAWRLEQILGGPDSSTTLLEDRVLALDFSPDGRLLAIGGGTASRSGQVVIWNLQDDRLHCQLEQPHDDAVLGLAFSRDGRRLATASADRMMKVFEVDAGSLVQSLRRPHAPCARRGLASQRLASLPPRAQTSRSRYGTSIAANSCVVLPAPAKRLLAWNFWATQAIWSPPAGTELHESTTPTTGRRYGPSPRPAIIC